MGNSKQDTRTERIAPHEVDAEQAVIGAVLGDPASFGRVSGLLLAEDFFIERNGWVWDAFSGLVERGISPDFVTVSAELSQRGQLEEAGGRGYLVDMSMRTPSSLGIESYARIVAECSYRRRLIRFGEMTANLAHKNEMPLLEIHDKISHTLTQIGGKTIKTHRSAREAFTDFVGNFAIRVQDARDGRPHVGLDTGIPECNAMMDGDFKPGTYTAVMGLTKVGKTWYLMQLALSAARQVPVIYISLENLEDSLLDRFISIESGIPLTCVRTGMYKGQPMPDDMTDKVYKASDVLASLPIEFVCHLNSAREIEHHIKSATIRHGQVGMAFVDTLNQLADAGASGGDNGRYENLAKASGRLLQTMRSTGWGIVTAIQMRMELKAGMKHGDAKNVAFPTIQSVEGCRKIVQDVSKLIGIYRADYVAEKINDQSYIDDQCPKGMALLIDVASRDSEGVTDCLIRWNRKVPRFETALDMDRTHVDLDTLTAKTYSNNFVMGRDNR